MGLIISHLSASAHGSAPVVRSTPTGSVAFGLMAMTGAIGFLPNASSKLTGSVSSAVDGHWPGTDCFFYVSGSGTSDGSGDQKAVFGGDVVISGTLNGGKPVNAAGTAAKYRIAIFDDADTIGGESGLTWGNADGGVGGGILGVTGSIRLKGALDLDATGSIDLATTAGVSIDGATASNVTVTGAGQSLTLAAAGGGSQEVNIDSAGTGAAAIDLNATAGGITLDASSGVSLDGGAASNFSTSAGSLTISSEANRLFLTGATGVGIQGELAGGSAIVIKASNAAGGISIDAGTGGISLDSDGASNLSTTKGSITVAAEASRLFLTGAQGVGIKGESADADAVAIQASDAAGGITLDAGTSGISLDSSGASNFSTSAGSVTISSEANRLFLTGATGLGLQGELAGADAIVIKASNAAGGINVDAGTAGIAIDATGGSHLKTSAGSVTVSSEANRLFLTGAQGVGIKGENSNTNAVKIEASAGGVTIDGKTGVYIQENGTNVIAIDTTQELSLGVSGKDVIIVGDLQVQGSTTTISSSNTTIKDSIIGLGVSGSDSFNNVGDRAVIFARGSAAHSFLPALNYDGSEFEFGTFSASPSSGSMGAHQAGVPVRTGHLKPISDDGATLGDANERWSDLFLASGGVVNFDNGNVSLTHSSNAITVSSTDKLQFQDSGTFINSSEDGELNLSADGAMVDAIKLSAASGGVTVDAGGDIVLDADGGNVTLKDGGTIYLDIINSSGDAVLSASVHNKDVIFHGNNATEVFKLDSSANSLFVASGKKIELGHADESIVGDGTNLAVSASANFTVDAAADIILDAGGANVTLKDDGSTFLDFVNSSGNVTLDGAGSISIDSHSGAINLMRSGSSLASLNSVARGFEIDVPQGNLFLDAGGDDIEIDNHLIPFDQSGHSNDGKYELGQGVGLKGATTNSSLGSSSTPFQSAFSSSTAGLSSITMSDSGEFGLLLSFSSLVVGDAISGGNTAFGSLSAGSLATNTTFISAGSSSMTLSKGDVLVFQDDDASDKMVFLVTSDYASPSSSVAVRYHTGLSSGNATSLSTLNSTKVRSGTISNGGLSLADESLIEFTIGGETFIFTVKEAVSSTDSVIFVDPTTNGTGTSFGVTSSGRTAKTGGSITTRNAWKSVHTDNIDIGNSGIISLGGSSARIDLDADDDTSVRSSADDVIDFELGGTDRFQMTTSAFVPGADNSYDLGSESLRFRNIFTGDLNLRNDRGDWTLIEEDDFISFRNNKTGHRFRMVMENITGMGNYGPGNDGEM